MYSRQPRVITTPSLTNNNEKCVFHQGAAPYYAKNAQDNMYGLPFTGFSTVLYLIVGAVTTTVGFVLRMVSKW